MCLFVLTVHVALQQAVKWSAKTFAFLCPSKGSNCRKWMNTKYWTFLCVFTIGDQRIGVFSPEQDCDPVRQQQTEPGHGWDCGRRKKSVCWTGHSQQRWGWTLAPEEGEAVFLHHCVNILMQLCTLFWNTTDYLICPVLGHKNKPLINPVGYDLLYDCEELDIQLFFSNLGFSFHLEMPQKGN